jgi:hypothetical protein
MQNLKTVSKLERFTAPFMCSSCDQAGTAVWEEERLPNGAATGQSKLISVSNGFHVGEGANLLSGPKIVCDRCDTVQPD